MSKIKMAIGAAVAGVALVGTVMVAPPASALLCGYPPVECPAGSTNPPENQQIGATPAARAQAGMTLPSQDAAVETPPTRPPAPPSVDAIGTAPRVPAERGDTVRLRSQAEPSTQYRVLVKRNDGPYNFIGVITANAGGGVTLPAVQFDRRGVYTFALQGSDGTTLYMRVDVA